MGNDTDTTTVTRTRRRWLAIAAGAVVVVLVAAVAIVALTDIEEPGAPDLTDVALYAPDAPADLPLLAAKIGDRSEEAGHVAIYGQNDQLTGPAMVLASFPTERRFPVEANPVAHQEVVEVGYVDGLLTADPASGRLTLVWQPTDDRQNVLFARGFDASTVNAAARSVTGGPAAAAFDDPSGFGLRPIVEGHTDDFVSGTFEPGPGGASVAYGDDAGHRQLIVLTGGDDFAVPVAGIVYAEARDVVVAGDRALSALIGPDPDDPAGAIVVWREDDGTVVRVVGLNMDPDDVVAAAQTVHPITGDEFLDLQKRSDS